MGEFGHRIECVAIMDRDGTIYSLPQPARHHDVIPMMVNEKGCQRPVLSSGQGFLTEDETFVNRVAAKRIATEAGQLLEREAGLRELFSEDVW